MDSENSSIDEIGQKVSQTTTDAVEYIQAYADLTKVRLLKHGINLSASLFNVITITIFGVFFIIFTGIGGAIWLNIKLNSPYLGYFIMAGAFALTTLILILVSHRLIFNYFRKVFVSKIYEQD